MVQIPLCGMVPGVQLCILALANVVKDKLKQKSVK
jgi:hypothetical protein